MRVPTLQLLLHLALLGYVRPIDAGGMAKTTIPSGSTIGLSLFRRRNMTEWFGGILESLNSLRECGMHLAFETARLLQTVTVMDTWTSDKIYHDYLESYDHLEQGQGSLNRKPFRDFQHLSEVPLLRRMAEYVSMSYCLDKKALEALRDKNLRTGSFEVHAIGKDWLDEGRMKYYTAYNPDQKMAILSLRGTLSAEDVWLDIHGLSRRPDPDVLPLQGVDLSKESVHSGFWILFTRYREQIQRDVRALMERVPQGTPLVLVGHSLGTPWAFFQGADLVLNLGLRVDAMYLFEAPYWGTRGFVDAIARTIGEDRIFRIANGKDIIIHYGLLGEHPSRVKEIFVDPETNKTKICEGPEDPTCSKSVKCNDRVWDDHLYFHGIHLITPFCRIQKKVPDSVYVRASQHQ